MTERATNYILKLQCRDQPGIIHRVTAILVAYHANITDSEEFNAPETGWFFMRLAFTINNDEAGLQSELSTRLGKELRMVGAKWRLRRQDQRYRTLILCSTQDHCLADLLCRHQRGELPMDIRGVVSNHPKERALKTTDIGSIPYYHWPIIAATKPEQESRIKNLIIEQKVDLVILARYMQILSGQLSSALEGHCINIHHSFLPGFKGAKPYHQAHRRGVKLIGATAHYVTSDLDEGPIIRQDVTTVTHRDGLDELIRIGRGLEQRVLSDAVRLWLDDRVFFKDRRTVVFDH